MRFIVRVFLIAFLMVVTAAPRAVFAVPAGQQDRGAIEQPKNVAGGSGPTGEVRPESGSVTDNVYTNNYFGFAYEFPKGWWIADDATKKYMMEMGQAVVSGGDPTKRAIAEVAEKRSHQLLAVFEHPFGTPVKFNSNIVVQAQEVSYLPGVQKGSDYLLNFKAAMTGANPDLKILREPTDFSVGGRTFSRLDVSIEKTIGATIYQSFAATILNSYALVFTFSANKPERLATLADTLNTLQFKPELVAPSMAPNAQLQSIPQVTMLTPAGGIEFEPYILGTWNAIKRKWYAIMPDSALQGTKGKVILVFGIKRDGKLSDSPKVELSSGIGPLDEAAIAAVRVSAPFSPFPREFRGKEIRLRMIFLYNIPAETVLK
jgi:TonB family protein